MELEVSFKSFVYWDDDANTKPEVRRFALDQPGNGKFNPLKTKLRELYPKLRSKKFTIAWTDEDGDEILMSTDGEMKTMFDESRDSVIKLIVRCIKNDTKDDEEDIVPEYKASPPTEGAAYTDKAEIPQEFRHEGVSCDVCGSAVIGHRYKCISCNNFDLCANCENKGKHPDHCVVRVPSRNMSIPLLKASIKKSRRFLKSQAAQVQEENKKLRRERKHASDHHTQGKQDSQPRLSRNWADIFGKYMEEFANVAGDFTRTSENNATEAAKNTDGHSAGTAGAKTTEPRASTSGTAPGGAIPTKATTNDPWGLPQEDLDHFKHAMHACKYLTNNAVSATTKALDKALEIAASIAEETKIQLSPGACSPDREFSRASFEAAKGKRERIAQQAAQEAAKKPETDSKPQESPKPFEGTALAEQPLLPTQVPSPDSAKTIQNDIMKITFSGQGNGTPETTGSRDIYVKRCDISELVNAVTSTDMCSNAVSCSKSEMSSNSSSCSSEGHGSDKAEGWTVIDPESAAKDLDNFPANMNELPEEIQERIRYHAPIYPPLNAATAVLDPKETTAVPSAPPMTKPAAKDKTDQTNRAAQANAAAEALRKNLAPHVEAAVRQMEAMGFSNESGWLTQLLDHNDGNIATVLDLITPNIPSK